MPLPSQEPFILPESTNQAIFQQFIQHPLLRFSKPVVAPVVVFLSGQPGSGKSSLAAYYGKQFNEAGDGIVTINSDELREYHPEYAVLQRANPDYASFLVNPDTRAWQHKLIKVAIAQRRHTLLDGTLGGPVEPILETMQQFRQAGYVIWVGIMAVPAYQSRLGIYQRYEDQLALKGSGRWVGMATHDRVFEEIPQNLDLFQQQSVVDQIQLYARPKGAEPPALLYDNHRATGQRQPDPMILTVLRKNRNQWLTKIERAEHKYVTATLLERMTLRGASQAAIDDFVNAVRLPGLYVCRATADDVQLYYVWVNDPATRQQSFNSEPISWEDHVAWFSRKLTDPNVLLLVFVVQGESGDPVGQVRFEKQPDGEAIIGVSVDASFRGKGLASWLIQAAVQTYQEDWGDVPITAYIKPENVASVRAFERAGFVQQSSGQTDRLRLVKH